MPKIIELLLNWHCIWSEIRIQSYWVIVFVYVMISESKAKDVTYVTRSPLRDTHMTSCWTTARFESTHKFIGLEIVELGTCLVVKILI